MIQHTLPFCFVLLSYLTITAQQNFKNLGCSVAISGNYAIVGADASSIHNNAAQGLAYIYSFDNQQWNKETTITNQDGTIQDRFGASVAINDNFAVVGSKADDVGSNTDQGSVHVFKHSGNKWIQMPPITASDGHKGDAFGSSVAISGNMIAVGAYKADNDIFEDQGAVYIYEFKNGVWVQTMKINHPEAFETFAYFGHSLAIHNNHLVIGAGTEKINDNLSQGAAYVYQKNGQKWVLQSKLIAKDGAAGDWFGTSVAIDGDLIAVGASYDQVKQNKQQGSVYVFEKRGNKWIQKNKITASDGSTDDFFGTSIALRGEYLVVGAFQDDFEADEYIIKNQGSA